MTISRVLVLACCLALAACAAKSGRIGESLEDGRIELMYGGREVLEPAAGDRCAERFIASAATGTVVYENAEHGVAFDLPYDPAWGNETYSVPSFEESDGVTFFGPVVKRGSTCAWVRAIRLEFVPAKGAPEVAAAAKSQLLKELSGQKLEIGSEPQVIASDEFVAVESLSMTPECRRATLEVVGTDFNVRISTCGQGVKRIDDFRPLRTIARSMRAGA
jgi:hypothetical protein